MINFHHFLTHLYSEIKKHLFPYLVLLTGAIFFLLLFSIFMGNRANQFLIFALFIIFYITCGITHHLLEKTLHLKIVVEYILIGAIALFLLKVLLIP